MKPPEGVLRFRRPDHPFTGYAFELCASLLGLLPAVSQDRCDLAYGAGEAKIVIPTVARYTRATVPRLPTRSDVRLAHDPHATFPFDLISAMRFWLADEGNERLDESAYDEHGRLRPEASAQSEVGALRVPIVNAYVELLGEWLEARRGPRVRRPPATVVLSHDVDSAVDPLDVRHTLRGLPRAWRAHGGAEALRRTAAAAGRRAAEAIRDPRARHALFAEVAAAEAERGLRSTFFFASTSRFDPDGARPDVAYLFDRPPLPDACRSLAHGGFEIGVHLGYRAYLDPAQIRAEVDRVAAAAGAPVAGSRHHYWHMARPMWPTLAAHHAGGLAWDSSVAFNDVPGYRLGVAAAFEPWDPQHERRIPVVQVPCGLMDSSVLGGAHATLESATAAIDEFLATLKRYRGTAAVDWHEYTSLPRSKRYAAWGRAYLHLLDAVAADRDMRVLSFAEVAAEARA